MQIIEDYKAAIFEEPAVIWVQWWIYAQIPNDVATREGIVTEIDDRSARGVQYAIRAVDASDDERIDIPTVEYDL